VVLGGVWVGCEEAITRRWEAVIKGLGKRRCFFRCVIHWTQGGCLKQTGVSLGLALNCGYEFNSIGALAVSEESVRTLFEAESRQREIVKP
jgi:hypothetical protein